MLRTGEVSETRADAQTHRRREERWIYPMSAYRQGRTTCPVILSKLVTGTVCQVVSISTNARARIERDVARCQDAQRCAIRRRRQHYRQRNRPPKSLVRARGEQRQGPNVSFGAWRFAPGRRTLGAPTDRSMSRKSFSGTGPSSEKTYRETTAKKNPLIAPTI